MYASRWMSLMRHVSVFGSAVMLASTFASAQSSASQNQSNAVAVSPSESSSNTVQMAEFAAPDGMAALPSAPNPSSSSSGAAAGQSDTTFRHGLMRSLAFEFGGGFNAPAGDKAYITWGGQFIAGGGIHVSKYLSVLAEYQFIDDKLPGAIIAEAEAQGGYAHIWSLTVDPVVDLFPKSANDLYVTGGGGFYRKLSSFTDPEEEEVCYYFCSVETANAVVSHFSSNQGGFNIGGGYQRRVGGMYGDGKTKLFAEVRYLDVLTPAVTGISPSGMGVVTIPADTKLLPITLGVRW